jgi:S-adenosyl-L-methionine hydrolase (adenosine-forming)
VITLLTDFGLADYFVGAVKGAILSIHPGAQLIDLSHEVPPHDIQFAAFTLAACAREFPARTIHLVVVDPGVGSERRPIVVESADQLFVGPDNGVFTHVYHGDNSARVFHATRAELFRPQPSHTFHGRDIFGPLAAHLDLGFHVEEVGPAITDSIQLADVFSSRIRPNEVVGSVIHIDRFGNCVTNLTEQQLSFGTPATFEIDGRVRVTRLARTYAAGADSNNDPIAYIGSAGYWEIGIWRTSVADKLSIARGMEVRVKL